MDVHRPTPSCPILRGVVYALAATISAGPTASARAADATISACANKKGVLRLLASPTAKCKKRERLVTWSVVGPQGADGPTGAPGDATVGAAGPTGPTGPSTGAASGDLTGTFPSPTVRLQSSDTDAGPHTAFATACSTTLASVTVTVPTSGFVEVLAVADLQAVGNTANVCVGGVAGSPQQVMSANSLSYETRYGVRASTSGTTTSSSVEWLPFFVSAGSHTITLLGGHTGGGSANFRNGVLLVRAIN